MCVFSVFLFHLIDDIGFFFVSVNQIFVPSIPIVLFIANTFCWKFYFLYSFLLFFFSISSFIHPRFLIYLFFFRQNFKSNKDKNYIDSRRGNFHISRKKHDYSLYGRSILQDDDVSESVEQPTINYNGVLGRRGAPSL